MQIHPCHADLGESELLPPSLQLRHVQRAGCGGASLRVMDVHALIVKTPPWQLRWPDENATAGFARQLAALPALADAFITLHGPLGAGKTTLVRHLLQALGVQGRIKSPTYAVVEPYALPGLDIWHFDFYRFNDPREWEDAGFRDIFASPGLKLAEWPDKAAAVLPPADLAIALQTEGDQARLAQLQAHTPRGQSLLAALGAAERQP